MSQLLSETYLHKYSDADLEQLIEKLSILGARPGSRGAQMQQEIRAELERRAAVVIRPEWVNPKEEWLLEVVPGKWITASNEDLAIAAGITQQTARLSPETLRRVQDELIRAGRLRPNPNRTRVTEEIKALPPSSLFHEPT